MKLTYGEQIARTLDALFVDGRPAPSATQVAAAYPFDTVDRHLAKLWMAEVSKRREAHNRRDG